MLKTTQLARNLLLLIAEIDEISNVSNDDNYKDETVKKSLLTSKNLNRATGYLTPNAKQVFI